jgi:cellulose synthase/poly-beta-1,6-N-acetylglucosamine synthase-like glycosyltransferase
VTQYYTYRKFRLDRAPKNTRILITCFYVMVTLAVLVGVINYKVRTGLTPAGTEAWYRGNEQATGPVHEMFFPKTVRELLDVTHPHLFEQTLFMFVLCHLFGLTSARERSKRWVYLFAFGSVLLDTAMPWLTTFVSPHFAPLHVGSSILLSVMFLILMGRPLYEMWWAFDREEKYDWAVE